MEYRDSLDAVMPEVYRQLRVLAASYLRNERDGHTLQPTALVHEAYLRLLRQHSVDFASRTQLLGVATQMMRRICAPTTTSGWRRSAAAR